MIKNQEKIKKEIIEMFKDIGGGDRKIDITFLDEATFGETCIKMEIIEEIEDIRNIDFEETSKEVNPLFKMFHKYFVSIENEIYCFEKNAYSNTNFFIKKEEGKPFFFKDIGLVKEILTLAKKPLKIYQKQFFNFYELNDESIWASSTNYERDRLMDFIEKNEDKIKNVKELENTLNKWKEKMKSPKGIKLMVEERIRFPYKMFSKETIDKYEIHPLYIEDEDYFEFLDSGHIGILFKFFSIEMNHISSLKYSISMDGKKIEVFDEEFIREFRNKLKEFLGVFKLIREEGFKVKNYEGVYLLATEEKTKDETLFILRSLENIKDLASNYFVDVDFILKELLGVISINSLLGIKESVFEEIEKNDFHIYMGRKKRIFFHKLKELEIKNENNFLFNFTKLHGFS